MGEDRKGIVFFKRAEDMEKAMEVSRGNSFFGCEMSLSVWDGADLGVDDSEVKYFEKELDEFHPRATRTLFVGNLDRSVTREDLEEAFQKFGEIVHIEIKKPPSAQPFAFLQFSDIDSVVRARKKLDGEYVGKNKVKSHGWCDRRTNMALVFFINIDDSQKAVEDLKIGNILGRRPKVDFASRECQNHFYDRMEQTGQAAYYNHSRETSPTGPTYPREKYPKAQRRVSRPQSSSKYSGGGSGGGAVPVLVAAPVPTLMKDILTTGRTAGWGRWWGRVPREKPLQGELLIHQEQQL
ncbi:putative msx2-interacting protein isoform X2 [Apostichopus japonicus]|uniref:Putative msx2-interacting protein isoform X2 n=1 Tax=Stichopus japonicus TaxID=307972 RepID=A0A2G8JXA0_STIJA|nr:putative msx2-interacting protein isoform X2 [Apostichopus japonicus]